MKIDEKAFPTVLMILDIFAAGAYISSGNWRKIIYWLAVAVLTYVVTY